MRKKIVALATPDAGPRSEPKWLELEDVAEVEVTSEEPNFPIESALIRGERPGWRASQKGQQKIRIIFDQPRPLRRIMLEFSETEIERTQEFTLRWSADSAGPFRDIVRQQWSFSPQGSTSEVEDYQVGLDSVSVLELALKPDLTPDKGIATLARWRVA